MFKFKDDNKCRTCKHRHPWVVHSLSILSCDFYRCFCGSKDWAPMDNLEYLEGLYEQKGAK